MRIDPRVPALGLICFGSWPTVGKAGAPCRLPTTLVPPQVDSVLVGEVPAALSEAAGLHCVTDFVRRDPHLASAGGSARIVRSHDCFLVRGGAARSETGCEETAMSVRCHTARGVNAT